MGATTCLTTGQEFIVKKLSSLIVPTLLIGSFFYLATPGNSANIFATGSINWWLLTAALHLPYFLILFFLVGGVIERLGYYWRGRAPQPAGQMPMVYPTVCVQLPMFNEHTVAERIIKAASEMTWQADRLTIQVLDDSTDEETRLLVEAVCARIQAATGVNCYVRHRNNRQGYKAGALEAGRKETNAEFLAIFDSDFVPPKDYLLRTIPHFYLASGEPDTGLALVQAQWGHLNHDESSLTLSQSLWVDDHHTLQMSWRSAMWQFVNFTGTAGVWRAATIEGVGGWSAASLVEDCELSFRHLFAGYRTKFVKEIVVPAELPATYTAYKAQQKRWTQGWAQLQKLHLRTLLFEYPCSLPQRIHLFYHMCIAWQWPAWALWITLLPLLIYSGFWFGSLGFEIAVSLYLLPAFLWSLVVAAVASLETKHTYPEKPTYAIVLKRALRIVPNIVINIGMLPHQCCAFVEGIFGPLHSEFERTPKAGLAATEPAHSAKPTPQKRSRVKFHWRYILMEAFFIVYQSLWMLFFAVNELLMCVAGAGAVALCVSYVGFFYGDNAGKVCFVFDKHQLMRVNRRREAVASHVSKGLVR
jgi:cellulose synthase/poly-beta-1,6-N-acetylglucosamine synthase-like glycosyltransferase